VLADLDVKFLDEETLSWLI